MKTKLERALAPHRFRLVKRHLTLKQRLALSIGRERHNRRNRRAK